jgi:hypothetical protein
MWLGVRIRRPHIYGSIIISSADRDLGMWSDSLGAAIEIATLISGHGDSPPGSLQKMFLEHRLFNFQGTRRA